MTEEFENLAEFEVRQRLVKGEYGTVGEKRARIVAWLGMKAHLRSEASSSIQIRYARSAKNAAWAAAIAAIIAAIFAMIAIIPIFSPTFGH